MKPFSEFRRLGIWIRLTILLALVALLLLMLPGAISRGHAAWLYVYGPPPTLADMLGVPALREGLITPRAIERGPDGTLYVAMMEIGQVWALRDDGDEMLLGELGSPAGLALGPQGDLWVSAYSDGQVLRRSREGEIVVWASGLDGPKGLAFDRDGSLIVAEFDGGRVTALPARAESRPIAEDLTTPAAVVFDEAGRCIVACTGSRQVLRLESDGTRTVLAEGLGGPSGLALLRSGDLAVADVGFGDLQIIRADGGEGPVFRSFSGGYIDVAQDEDGSLLVCHFRGGLIVRLDVTGGEI